MSTTPQSAFFLIANDSDDLQTSRDRTLDIFGLVDGYATSRMQPDAPDSYQSIARQALLRIPALGPSTGSRTSEQSVSCLEGVARVLGRMPFSRPEQQVNFLVEQGLIPPDDESEQVALTLYCGEVSPAIVHGGPTIRVWFAFVNWTRGAFPESGGSISCDAIGASVLDNWFSANAKAWATMTKAGNGQAVRESHRLLELPARDD